MSPSDIARLRLANQRVSPNTCSTPEEVVSRMGAMQAQDYPMSLWAIGLRTDGYTEADIETAVRSGTIVRTWTMRRTIHFAAAEDVHWMMQLTRDRVIKTYGKNMTRLGLDEEMLAKARRVVATALEREKCLTREALYERLSAAGIPTDRGRGIHLLWRIGQEAITCFGPREGKQQTFVLLDDWVPRPRVLSRDEAIIEATRRYFTSHGPATAHDFAWWSGLTMKDIRGAIESADLAEERVGDSTYYIGNEQPAIEVTGVHLLPAFDEYLVSYKDRSAVIGREHMGVVNRGMNGMFSPIVVVDGEIRGTWKRGMKKDTVTIRPTAFATFTRPERVAIADKAKHFGAFVGLEPEVSFE